MANGNSFRHLRAPLLIIGLSLVLAGILWWFLTFGRMAQGTGVALSEVSACLFYTPLKCQVASNIAEFAGLNFPYTPVPLWIGVVTLVASFFLAEPASATMANGKYEPPKQSVFGQIFDSIFLLVLVGLSLFVPLWMGLAGGGKTALEFADKTWTGMKQNEVTQAAYEKLGYTAESAHDLLASRFDYSFNMTEAVITAIVLVAYFVFVFRFSDKEYRDVIRERFGDK